MSWENISCVRMWLSEGVLFLQHRKQRCMSYSLNAGGERERCIRPRCSEQANDQSHRLEQNQSIQIRTRLLPRVRNDLFSKSSCILHLILSVCYDTLIRALNTGCVKMLLSNLKIILRGWKGGWEDRTASRCRARGRMAACLSPQKKTRIHFHICLHQTRSMQRPADGM